jgi:hypothetical protein
MTGGISAGRRVGSNEKGTDSFVSVNEFNDLVQAARRLDITGPALEAGVGDVGHG